MTLQITLKQVLNWRKTPRDYDMEFSKFDLPIWPEEFIRGWHIPAKKKVTILIVPGFRTNKGLYLELAQAYHNMGFPVTLFDARGQGESKSSINFSFGYYEVEDIQRIIRAFPGKYALLGFSCGATAGLIASLAMPNSVAVTIADSAFVSLERIKHHSRENPVQRLLMNRLLTMIEKCQERIPGFSEYLNLEQRCQELKKVLFIHGKNDRTIRWTNSEFMFDKAQYPKQLWLPRQAGHCEAVMRYSEQYLKITANFIEECLLIEE